MKQKMFSNFVIEVEVDRRWSQVDPVQSLIMHCQCNDLYQTAATADWITWYSTEHLEPSGSISLKQSFSLSLNSKVNSSP